jgi:hypothetical protein
MGLDMYLNKRVYVGGEYAHNKVSGAIVMEDKTTIPANKISYITIASAYWRKANHIHKWFVDNVQDGNDDCETYYVPKEKLLELLGVCQNVIDTAKIETGTVRNGAKMVDGGWEDQYESGFVITNPEEVSAILPCSGGFFFGSTDYDQWYIRDVKSTISQITDALADGIEGDYCYMASW